MCVLLRPSAAYLLPTSSSRPACPHHTQLYLSPALRLSEAEFTGFLQEADTLLRFLDTGAGSEELEVGGVGGGGWAAAGWTVGGALSGWAGGWKAAGLGGGRLQRSPSSACWLLPEQLECSKPIFNLRCDVPARLSACLATCRPLRQQLLPPSTVPCSLLLRMSLPQATAMAAARTMAARWSS